MCLPEAGDIFALGWVMYFIMVSEDPYSDLHVEEVKHRFERQDFPASSHIGCGAVSPELLAHGRFTTAEHRCAGSGPQGAKVPRRPRGRDSSRVQIFVASLPIPYFSKKGPSNKRIPPESPPEEEVY